MKIDVSNIVKVDGSTLEVEVNEVLNNLNTSFNDVAVNKPVSFKGMFQNISGMLKLKGRLNATYTTKCSKCLKDVSGNISVDIEEGFIKSQINQDDLESYTYEGNFVEIDRALKDNVILNLPSRQVCNNECKGLCEKCGTNLNEMPCKCEHDKIDSRMSVLENFFKN